MNNVYLHPALYSKPVIVSLIELSLRRHAVIQGNWVKLVKDDVPLLTNIVSNAVKEWQQ